MEESWCASSTTVSGMSGRISSAPSSDIASELRKRWWFTTRMSACFASRRAFVRKHSPKSGHFVPGQFSFVDVT